MIWIDVIKQQYLNTNLLKLNIVSLSYTVFHGLSSVGLLFCRINFIIDGQPSLSYFQSSTAMQACRILKITVSTRLGATFLSEANLKIQWSQIMQISPQLARVSSWFFTWFLWKAREDALWHLGRKEIIKNGWHILVLGTLFLVPSQTWKQVC